MILASPGYVRAQADTYHTPLDPEAHSGALVGTITDAREGHALQRVIAVEPIALKAYAAELDRNTGRFELRGLPPGEYDLLIKSVGRVHEGLTLALDPSAEPPTKEALAQMVEGVGETLYPAEAYFERKHIVRLTGSGETARAFVVFTRTRPTRRPGGGSFDGHVRRFAFVQMMHTRKVWQIETVRHLLRQEVPDGSPDINVKYHYSPDLGGFLVGEQTNDVGELDLEKIEKKQREREDKRPFGSGRHPAPEKDSEQE